MDAISASVGRRFFELSVQTLMKRMLILLGWCFAVTALLSNGAEANRQETEILRVYRGEESEENAARFGFSR
jgi:hypothetical protein